jgi:superfamily II DNA helicase RecQ
MTLNSPDQKILELRLAEMDLREKLVAELRAVHRRKLWKERGFRSLADFCEMELGFGRSEIRELLIAVGVILTQDRMTVEDPYVQHRINVLKTWRRQKSSKLAVAPYRVISNRTLMALASINPQCLDDLAQVPGIGRVKMNSLGDEILNCLGDSRVRPTA